jgi:hypothetical protein
MSPTRTIRPYISRSLGGRRSKSSTGVPRPWVTSLPVSSALRSSYRRIAVANSSDISKEGSWSRRSKRKVAPSHTCDSGAGIRRRS